MESRLGPALQCFKSLRITLLKAVQAPQEPFPEIILASLQFHVESREAISSTDGWESFDIAPEVAPRTVAG